VGDRSQGEPVSESARSGKTTTGSTHQSSDHPIILRIAKLPRDPLHNLLGPLHVSLVIPPIRTPPLSRIIKPVLTPRCTMEVDDHLQAGLTGPRDRSVEVFL
jgi:hypothetical protein